MLRYSENQARYMIDGQPLRPGDRLGRYELVSPIAEGGMAAVWVARFAGTRGFRKAVAVKVMLPALREDPDAERLFLAEASLASKIRHPNVVETLELGEERDLLYIVMELVEGAPLSALLRRTATQGNMPLPLAVHLACQVCAGLHAAHELTDDSGKPLKLVHRDVSPHNVLLGFNGIAKVTDFGIAKTMGDASWKTQSGQLRGKIAYMAPEQARFEPLDRRTDVFAAGLLAYLMTTGRHPFRATDARETLENLLSSDPLPPPSAFVDRYPRRLERAVMRALEKEPSGRFETASDFSKALTLALPPTLRRTTDEEMMRYVQSVLADRVAAHRELARRLAQTPRSGPPRSTTGRKRGGQSTPTFRAVALSSQSGEPSRDGPDSDRQTPSISPPVRRPIAHAKTLVVAAAGAVLGSIAVIGLTGTDARPPWQPDPSAADTHAPVPPSAGAARVEAESPPATADPSQNLPDRAALPHSGDGQSEARPPASHDAGAGRAGSAKQPAANTPRHLTKPQPAPHPKAPARRAAKRPNIEASLDLKDPYGD